VWKYGRHPICDG